MASSFCLIRLTERQPQRNAYRELKNEVVPETNLHNILLRDLEGQGRELGKITFVRIGQKNSLSDISTKRLDENFNCILLYKVHDLVLLFRKKSAKLRWKHKQVWPEVITCRRLVSWEGYFLQQLGQQIVRRVLRIKIKSSIYQSCVAIIKQRKTSEAQYKILMWGKKMI